MREIIMPKLTAYQQDAWNWLKDKKGTGDIAVIKACRQVGKSLFCLLKLIEVSLSRRCTSAIFEPTLNNARNMYKQFVSMLDGSGLMKIQNAQTLEVEFVNGSRVLFKSTEQKNRGFTITGLLILDECAYLDNEEIYTILPLAQANNAEMIVVSTPFVQDGYFYDMYLLGLENKNKHIKLFDWSKHPETSKFLTDERKAFYKQTMSKQKYRTEVEGEFLTNDGLLFTGLENCLGSAKSDTKIIYIGIDFASGTEGDYSVLTAINNAGEMVAQYANNNLSPMQQVEWLVGLIEDLASKYTIKTILGEVNSIGRVYIDAINNKIRKNHLQVTDWVTSNKSKQDLVTTLQIAFENRYITILDEPILLNELRRYEAEINPKTKSISYNGKGAHDDRVMSLMFAYWAYKKSLGAFEIRFSKN